MSKHERYKAGEPLGDCVTRPRLGGGYICGGGGGGGGDDGGAAAREAERQARISSATAAVNALFGIGPRTAPTPTGRRQLIGYDRTLSRPGEDGAIIESTSRITPDLYEQARTAQQSGSGKGQAADNVRYTPVYTDVMADKPTTAGAAADAREALYNTVRDDTRNFYSQQLGEDRDKASRELRFQAARSGTGGSSQAIDADREFNRANDRGLLEVANRADSAASNMRSSDEQARLGLISKIVAGMDQGSAISSSLSQLQTNAETARQNAMAGRMDNVFSSLFNLYGQQQAQAGQQAAQKQYGNANGNSFPYNGSYNGSLSRGM